MRNKTISSFSTLAIFTGIVFFSAPPVASEEADSVADGQDGENQWKSIEIEGEKPCKPVENNESNYGVLGVSSSTIQTGCKDEKVKYAPAIKTGTINCGKKYKKEGSLEKAFRHGLSESCYSCPKGYDRSLNPDINASDACVKTTAAETLQEQAINLGAAFTEKPHDKAFKDPRNGGEWWKCPKDRPRRTAYAVTSKKACATREIIGEKLAEAKFLGKINNPKPNGAFEDLGMYWKCPEGYGRSLSKVTAPDACIKTVPASTIKAKATYRGPLALRCIEAAGPGSWLNLESDDCYICPIDYIRTEVVAKNLEKEPKACMTTVTID